ncbi:MAG: glycoside hydrolase family 95 protein, partial [Bacteroidota bacterium]
MKKYGLDFATPAANWLEAIPLGNGHIGVMMYGNAVCETLSLNDDTLWSGYKQDYIKKDFAENLQKVRSLMLEGKREDAQDLLESRMLGPFSQAYLPLGDIRISYDIEAVDGTGSEDDSGDTGIVNNYRRHLDFESGIAQVSCEKSGSPFNISCFCSNPADVMVYRVKSPRKFSFSIEMDSQLKHDTYNSDNFLCMHGVAPSNIIIDDVYKFYTENNIISYKEIEKSIKFAAEVRVVTNGAISQSYGSLRVTECTYAELYYTSTTSFSKATLQEYCRETLATALKNGYEGLEEDHYKDFSDLYGRIQIDLGGVQQTTMEIYSDAKLGSVDGYAISTLFQYGRYLLISSSRKGTQAANLQGIWNKDLIPPWWCNYTLNINLQMNYWLAERTNLAECTEPLFDFIQRLSEDGKKTARENYGMNGFVAHHQTDIWAQTTPVGYYNKREKDSASWAMWNMSGAWLCLHLYEHYQFTGDEHFLSEFAGPIFDGCADFLFDYLVKLDGKFVAFPSTSPENLYYGPHGERLAICISSAMDIGILKEFFTAYVDICKHLNRPGEAVKAVKILKNLPDYTIADDRIQEWDGNYTAVESGHRHFSMLFGVYPYANQLDHYRIPAENA